MKLVASVISSFQVNYDGSVWCAFCELDIIFLLYPQASRLYRLLSVCEIHLHSLFACSTFHKSLLTVSGYLFLFLNY